MQQQAFPGHHGEAKECKALEFIYGPPQGRFLLSRVGCNGAGCIGLRNCGDGTIEMKRLYVRPAYRKHGLGKRLVEAAVSMAQEMGGSAVRLHTLPAMA
ncbi:MAG TPA: GNAT family N-acetyltransferase, partial [Synechococcus sp. UBA8638]|nr:GNAT family N-acetyltransferase [Synechococcus sp. UBA8638]